MTFDVETIEDNIGSELVTLSQISSSIDIVERRVYYKVRCRQCGRLSVRVRLTVQREKHYGAGQGEESSA